MCENYSYDYTQARVPLLSYGKRQPDEPHGLDPGPESASSRQDGVLNTYDSGQVDVPYKPYEPLSITGGQDYKKYGYVTTEMRRSNGTTANQEAVIPARHREAIPLSQYSEITTLDTKGLSAPAGTAVNWLVPNLNVANSLLSLYDQTAFGGAFHIGPEPALGNNNSVTEKDTGGYIQADWHTELGSWPFRGNVGVRYVKTDQTASGLHLRRPGLRRRSPPPATIPTPCRCAEHHRWSRSTATSWCALRRGQGEMARPKASAA